MLPLLRGDWFSADETDTRVRIKGNTLKMLYGGKHVIMESKIHVIEYKTSPGRRYIVSDDLTQRDFRGYTFFDIYGEMLTTRMIVCDAPSPVLNFVRKGCKPKNTAPASPFGFDGGFRGMRE